MLKRSQTLSGLRSSNDLQITQKVIKVLKFLKGPQKILKSSSKSSKISQRPRSPQYVIRFAKILNILKSPWNPRRPQVLNRSTRSHQLFLEGSSMFWEHQVLRSSKKSSKDTQSPEKVKKMHKRYPRSSGLSFSTDPQNVLKFLKMSTKPSETSEVHKRYSRRPQSPQKVINVLDILWSSNVPQMVIKSSSQSPQKFLKAVLNRSTRSHR